MQHPMEAREVAGYAELVSKEASHQLQILTIISLSVEQGGLAGFSHDSGELFFGGSMELSFNAIAALFQLTARSLAISENAGVKSTETSHANTAGSFSIITSAFDVCDYYYAYVNHRSLKQQPESSSNAGPRASTGADQGDYE
ncbi:hypothetical protein FHG87_017792 [Trinorchestia longiramus]|nr:hypothetical protein FHG87_017792 [Trinorchestia longiramus]